MAVTTVSMGGETVILRVGIRLAIATTMAAGDDWLYWALLSAVFAALTAIFAKIGLEGIESHFATLVRTFVIMITLTGFVCVAGKGSNPLALRPRTWLFLVLSGLATGAS
jgi:bacterial/archaeal transporter family protein